MTESIKEYGPYNFTSDCLPGLSKLIEECGEVIQVAGKLIATNGGPIHWADNDLYGRMASELGDLLAAISFFLSESPQFSLGQVMEQSMMKIVKFSRWHDGE